MIRHRRLFAALAAACSAALVLSACGGSGSGGDSATPAGDPVAGGEIRAMQTGEPRSLDPASLSNTWAHQPTLGNALYGTLMVNNVETLEIEYKMATGFTTTDGGRSFTLTLRPGLTFTDGTPLDAAAVKFNWDRLRDPALGSTTVRQASQITSSDVVDPTTLKVTMVAASPHFAQSLIAGALNWIASPAALQKGQPAFDENPVGAGPFTLVKWTRQDAIELARNPGYWDAPKPYVDRLTIRTVPDTNQRINAVSTSSVDLLSETNWSSLNRMEAAGYSHEVAPTGGGLFAAMNLRRAPFDDERARRAVVQAIDLDALNTVVYNGENDVPRTLFPEQSPYYSDIALPTTNKEEAQKLFDELAAAGKPVKFTFLSYPTTESKTLGEALQAQLSAFGNVEMKVEVADFGTITARNGARDFDMVVSSAIVQDPDFGLWTAFHQDSNGNFAGVKDEELSKALDAGRLAESDSERKAAYETVQKRLVELNPGIWYTRAVPAVAYGKNVHGVQIYTLGSPLPEDIWVSK
ncbi:ABC transporter substrate-binding protein [Rhodococcus sp. NPDC003348]